MTTPPEMPQRGTTPRSGAAQPQGSWRSGRFAGERLPSEQLSPDQSGKNGPKEEQRD